MTASPVWGQVLPEPPPSVEALATAPVYDSAARVAEFKHVVSGPAFVSGSPGMLPEWVERAGLANAAEERPNEIGLLVDAWMGILKDKVIYDSLFEASAKVLGSEFGGIGVSSGFKALNRDITWWADLPLDKVARAGGILGESQAALLGDLLSSWAYLLYSPSLGPETLPPIGVKRKTCPNE